MSLPPFIEFLDADDKRHRLYKAVMPLLIVEYDSGRADVFVYALEIHYANGAGTTLLFLFRKEQRDTRQEIIDFLNGDETPSDEENP